MTEAAIVHEVVYGMVTLVAVHMLALCYLVNRLTGGRPLFERKAVAETETQTQTPEGQLSVVPERPW